MCLILIYLFVEVLCSLIGCCLLFVFLVLMLSLCIKFYEFLNPDFLRILLLFQEVRIVVLDVRDRLL